MQTIRRVFLGVFGGLGILFLSAALAFSRVPLPDEESWILPFVFGMNGTVFLAVGLGLYLGLNRGARRRRQLREYGARASGRVEILVPERSIRLNRQHPLRAMVRVREPRTGEEKLLKSHPVFHPAVQAGDRVEVAFDPMDERKYAVLLPGGED